MTDLGLPYDKPTPQVAGRAAEKRMAKERGAKQHPNSGAGRIKRDASSDGWLHEFKQANRTHTLDSRDLDDLHTVAIKQDRDACYTVEFANGIVAECLIYRKERR